MYCHVAGSTPSGLPQGDRLTWLLAMQGPLVFCGPLAASLERINSAFDEMNIQLWVLIIRSKWSHVSVKNLTGLALTKFLCYHLCYDVKIQVKSMVIFWFLHTSPAFYIYECTVIVCANVNVINTSLLIIVQPSILCSSWHFGSIRVLFQGEIPRNKGQISPVKTIGSRHVGCKLARP